MSPRAIAILSAVGLLVAIGGGVMFYSKSNAPTDMTEVMPGDGMTSGGAETTAAPMESGTESGYGESPEPTTTLPKGPASGGTKREAPPKRDTPPPADKPKAPESREALVAAGTNLPTTLTTKLDSGVNKQGDAVEARLESPILVDGLTVFPAGSTLKGKVLEVENSGRVKGRAMLAVSFDTVVTPDGASHAISTKPIVWEAEGEGKRDAGKIAGSAGAGAIIGGILGGKKGAIKGGILGGAAGTAVILATKGDEVKLAAGSELKVEMAEATTVKVAS